EIGGDAQRLDGAADREVQRALLGVGRGMPAREVGEHVDFGGAEHELPGLRVEGGGREARIVGHALERLGGELAVRHVPAVRHPGFLGGVFLAGAHWRACSMESASVWRILARAKCLSFASIRIQGACAVLVRSIMSAAATWYWSHLSRFLQSSEVILKRLKRVFSRSLKRRYCSSLEICSQYLATMAPLRASCSSKALISE